METAQVVQLSALDAPTAAQLLAGASALDPAGLVTEAGLSAMCARGVCVAATSGAGQAVYVVHVQNGVAWIDAARGFGAVDWTALLLPIIEAQSKGVRSVAFQTGRPGLVKRAKEHGYSVRGWILSKDMTP